MLYYLKAYHQLRESGERRDLVVSVPSGNFGNLCAGLMTQQMGIPFKRFIAATNVNDTVVRYLEGSDYSPKETVPTLSNAMDVSDPSNFIRIETLLGKDTLRKQLKGYRFTDSETLEAIASIDKLHAYCLEPHGAIAYLGLERDQIDIDRELGIFLETAHPIKFAAAVEKALNRPLVEPEVIKALRHKSPQNERLSTYEELKSVLLSY